MGALSEEFHIPCSLKNFDEPESGGLDGEARGVVSTLVVEEARYGLEIMDVLIFPIDLPLVRKTPMLPFMIGQRGGEGEGDGG